MISILSQACSRHQIVQSPHMTRDSHHFRSQTKQNKTLDLSFFNTHFKNRLLFPKPSENLPAEMAYYYSHYQSQRNLIDFLTNQKNPKQNKTPRLSSYTPELLKIFQQNSPPYYGLSFCPIFKKQVSHTNYDSETCTTPTTTNPRSRKNQFQKIGELLSSQPTKEIFLLSLELLLLLQLLPPPPPLIRS
jgi:hypothetical protein